ncbi:hypothetical protein DVH24_038766 [Malus domestica]|uniref:Uncharacterized protein n=1 Tax=Malus domestica TaxID=3750 RepID=A0A498KFX1_MALDO|nr:hypothetical protein DVH24_038766 [Malus domestica]
MATASSTPKEKKTTTLPPRRGKIKGKIFRILVKAVIKMASKLGARRNNRKEGGRNSASVTPPPSAYNSDANSGIRQIKLQIFGNMVKAVSNMTSKPGAQGKNRGEGGGDSASTTPSPSAYNSYANSDI